ncbi:MAG: hypothetical protein LBV28_04020, partial [Puniceicoccales bacterium]|nr:hypothetical protein [Puniceicoccales bacterium]
MHIRQLSRFAALLALFALLAPAAAIADGTDLKNVHDANLAGNPKTALALAEPVITAALAAQDYDTALAAILEKTAATAAIEGRAGPAAAARVLTAHFEKAPPALKPMLAAALAHTWQNHYRNHRWQLLERSRAQTNGTDGDGTDAETWDATRVRAEIQRYHALALADAAALQRTPVTAFGAVLESGQRPDALRPTLYDFLIHDAIAFHSLGEQGTTQAEDHFQLTADSPLLGTLEAFLAWRPQTTDTDSSELQAIRLFQAVLRFHQNDTLALALSDADLHRILWASKTLGKADGTDAATERALRAHIERWKNHEPAADAAAELALHLRYEKPLEAYKAAALGIALHPASTAAARCRSIIANIEDPEFDALETEAVWNAPTPEITITYRNIETLHFRAIAADWHEFLARERSRPNSLNDAEFADFLKKAPAKTWQVALPKTADYATRKHSITAPTDLPHGFYFIVASVNENFSLKKNALLYTTVWVSDLALVFNGSTPNNGTESFNTRGYVLNAITGEPVPDATVTGWYLNRSRERVKVQPAKTDGTGAFSLQSPSGNNMLLLAESADGHRICSDNA